MFRFIVLLTGLVFLASACRSASGTTQRADEAFYERTVIPASRSRALYFYLPLGDSNPVTSVHINGKIVPFQKVADTNAVEVYLLEYDEPPAKRDMDTSPNYPELFSAQTFGAVIDQNGRQRRYKDIAAVKNPNLPE